MATDVTLKAGLRDGRGKGSARKLRADGRVPAVVYGGGEDSMALELGAHEAEKLFRSISVDNTIVHLAIEGVGEPVQTLVREIQTHPVRPGIVHVDFLRIQKGVAVELDVPIHLSGTPQGVRDEGGVLEQTLHQLPIRCIPSAIPEEFLIDVSGLEIGDSLQVADLALPEGVEALLEDVRVICSVQVPSTLASQTDDEAEDEDADEEPEVIGREGEEDEGGDESESRD
jgi:large subunit ribosomal protein L25